MQAKSAYAHFLARASALDPKSVPVSRAEAAIMRANIDKAVKAITPHFAALAIDAPTLDRGRIQNLPALVRAYEYAEKLVPQPTSTRTIEKALAEVGPIRTATLSYLDSAAFKKLVDPGRVQTIHKGRGKLDVATDCVSIAGLFEDSKKELAGKHPFDKSDLATLRDTGGWLVSVLKPSGAVRDPKTRLPAAVMKDRFAQLCEEDYALLLQGAVALWTVDGYRDHVPALHARARAAVKKNPPAGGGGAP